MTRLCAAAVCLLSLSAVGEEPPAAKTLPADQSHAIAGSLGDPLRSALILPGAGHLLSGLGYPIVRGQIPAAVRYEYDGVALPMPFHLHALHSVLHPGIVGSVSLVHASMDASIARRLSSVVRLQPTAAAGDFSGRAGLDLLNLSLLAQAPGFGVIRELSASGRFAWTPFVATSLMNLGGGDGAPQRQGLLGDWQLRAAADLLGGEVRLLVLGAADRVGTTGGTGSALGGAGFHRADLRLRRPLGKGELEVGVTGGWDAIGGEGGGEISRLRLQVAESSARTRLAYRLLAIPAIAFEVGADLEYRDTRLRQAYLLRPGDVADESRPEIEAGVEQTLARAVVGGAYARSEIRAGPLRIVPGARFDVYRPVGLRSIVTVEPRINAQLRLSDALSLRAAGGTTHQPPTYLVDLPGVEAAAIRHGLQALIEVEAGADYALTADTGLSATVYAHPYIRNVELSLFEADFLAADPAARVRERRTTGYGGGIELSFQRRWAEQWFARAAYSINLGVRRGQIARRDSTGAILRHEEASFEPSYEQSHVVNGALGRELGNGYRLTGALHFNTGAPESGGLFSFTRRQGRDPTGNRRWVPSDRDLVARLPPFYRLDIRLDKAWKVGTAAELIAHLEIQNFTLSREVFRWSYATPAEKSPTAQLDKQPMGLPPVVVPSLGVELRYR